MSIFVITAHAPVHAPVRLTLRALPRCRPAGQALSRAPVGPLPAVVADLGSTSSSPPHLRVDRTGDCRTTRRAPGGQRAVDVRRGRERDVSCIDALGSRRRRATARSVRRRAWWIGWWNAWRV